MHVETVQLPPPELPGSDESGGLRVTAALRMLLAFIYFFALTSLLVWQLIVSGDPLVAGALYFISLLTLVPFLFGRWCVADFLWIVFSLYCGALALLIKTWLGQPVQNNLVAPLETATYMVLGTLSALAGYLFARHVTRPRSAPFALTRLTSDPRFLSRFAVPLFTLGLAAQMLHSILRPRYESDMGGTSEGFGGFGVLSFLILLGLGLQATRWRRRTSPLAGPVLVLMMIALLTAAMLSNVKTLFVSGLAVVLLSMLVIEGSRIKTRQIVFSLLPVPLLLFYVAPLIQVMRPQLRDFSLGEVIRVMSDTIGTVGFNAAQLSERADQITAGYSFNYRPNATYLYPSTVNADRFALIMPTDQVVRQLPRVGTMGLSSLADVPEAYLPGFLYKKSGVASPDLIAWYYEIRARGSVARPVIGLIASCVALGGLVGTALVPFLVFALIFSLLNWLAGPLGSNGWSLFVLISYAQKIGERELAALMSIGARELPLILFTGFFLAFLNRYVLPMPRQRQPQPQPQSSAEFQQ